MKNHITTILLGFLSTIGYSQTTYNSPITENLLTQQIERLDRLITINPNLIIIETTIDSTSTDIQQLKINNVTRGVDKHGENLTYSCTSLDNKYPTLLIIYLAEKINEIHIIQPNINGNGNERFRFLID